MRQNNWNNNLSGLVRARKHTPFKWGENDCCTFMADAVKIITGNDIAVGYRGTYTDAASAQKVIDKFSGLENLLTHFFGQPHGANNAKRGDVVTFTADNGAECVGVVCGTLIAAPGDAGLNMFDIRLAKKSWRVD